jgi:hypothetical protein
MILFAGAPVQVHCGKATDDTSLWPYINDWILLNSSC